MHASRDLDGVTAHRVPVLYGWMQCSTGILPSTCASCLVLCALFYRKPVHSVLRGITVNAELLYHLFSSAVTDIRSSRSSTGWRPTRAARIPKTTNSIKTGGRAKAQASFYASCGKLTGRYPVTPALMAEYIQKCTRSLLPCTLD